MQSIFLHSIRILLIVLTALPVYGQRTQAYVNTNTTQLHISMEVYEYHYVDSQPQFPGGDNAMISFINNERRYPKDAYQDGIEGRVLCSFIVNTDGTLSHISVIKGVEESLNREAVRVISQMPPWKAGEIDNTPVPVYCIVPIPFRK